MARLTEINEITVDTFTGGVTTTNKLIGNRFFQQHFLRRSAPNLGNAITAVNTGAETVTVAGDQTKVFLVGALAEIFGSTGNDVAATLITGVVLNAGNTEITVAQNLTDNTADGTIIPTEHVLTSQGVVPDLNRKLSDDFTTIQTELNTASGTVDLSSIVLTVLAQAGVTNPPNNTAAGVRGFRIKNIYEVVANSADNSQSFIYLWEDRDAQKPVEYLVDSTVAAIKAAANG